MILTLPNLISLVRVALVPLFVWLLFGRDDPTAAGILLAVIGTTDWIDGFLARRLGQVSELGKVLDPLADRLAVAAAVIGGLIWGAVPGWFAIALIAREAVVGAAAILLTIKTGAKLTVRYLGKLSTFMLYFSIPAFFVHAGTDRTFFEALAWGFGIPGLVLYWVVAGHYLADARRILADPDGGVSSGPDVSGVQP